jgi:hypothetical protein
LATLLKNKGEQAVYNRVQKIKNRVLKGETSDVSPTRKTYKSKLQRNKKEMLTLLEHLMDTVGVGLHTRVLAWAAGEITSIDLYDSIKQYADKHNIEYTIPAQEEDDD